jgi:hypothetical protein
MRSPEDFPADIREMAQQLALNLEHGCEECDSCLDKIARALMERDRAATERAAKIADTIEQPGIPGTGEWLALGNFAGQIAAAIRSQP